MLRRLNDTVSVSGQIGPGDLPTIKESGFRAVVSARPDGEVPGQPSAAEIGEQAESLGLAYAHIPVIPGQLPSPEEAQRFAEIAEHGPVLAYCAMGPRAVLLASLAAVRRGRDVGDVIAESAEAGIDLSGARALLESYARKEG